MTDTDKDSEMLVALRETLGLTATDAETTMANAVTRLRRLQAEAAQFKATGCTLPSTVVARVQASVDLAMGYGYEGTADAKGPFNAIDVQRVLNAVLGKPQGDEEAPANALRYKAVRCMSPREFAELYEVNLRTGKAFDHLVDEKIAAAQKSSAPAGALPLPVHPAIGSPDWFAQLNREERLVAQRYIDQKVPVTVAFTTESGEPVWALTFVNTDFWANTFVQSDDADAAAKAWNDYCAGSTSAAE